MKVAIISDIHGNCFALEAVLSEAKKKGVTKLFVLGDIVGYYYYPEVVLELLHNWDFEIIRGNHEDILKEVKSGKINLIELIHKYGYSLYLKVKQLK
jgi:predicted phosphodiesterase